MYAECLVLQLRLSRLKRTAWLILGSDTLRMFTKEYITQFQVLLPFSFFKYPFLQDTPEPKGRLSYICGGVWQVSVKWKRQGILFPVLLQLKKEVWKKLIFVFCSLRTLGPLFQVLCSFLAFWTSRQDHILWFWSLKLNSWCIWLIKSIWNFYQGQWQSFHNARNVHQDPSRDCPLEDKAELSFTACRKHIFSSGSNF